MEKIKNLDERKMKRLAFFLFWKIVFSPKYSTLWKLIYSHFPTLFEFRKVEFTQQYSTCGEVEFICLEMKYHVSVTIKFDDSCTPLLGVWTQLCAVLSFASGFKKIRCLKKLLCCYSIHICEWIHIMLIRFHFPQNSSRTLKNDEIVSWKKEWYFIINYLTLNVTF